MEQLRRGAHLPDIATTSFQPSQRLHLKTPAHTANMASSSSQAAHLYKRFSRLAAAWPIDPLRPQLSFGSALRTNVSRALLDQPPPPLPASSKAEAKGLVSGGPGFSSEPEADFSNLKFKQLSSAELQYAEKALQSLEGIRAGKESVTVSLEGLSFSPLPRFLLRIESTDLTYFSHLGYYIFQHPMPSSILRPRGDPEYYTRIRKAVERLSRGESVKPTFAERIRIFFGSKR